MRRLLWLVVVATVLLSTVAYATTYSASVSTYNVTGSHSIQQKLSSLVDIQRYLVDYLSTCSQKHATLRNTNYFVSGTYNYVFHEPNDVWHDCGYKYRLPVLIEVDEPQTNVFIDLNISDSNFLGNLSAGNEVKVFVDSISEELKFNVENFTQTYIIYRVYFDYLDTGFHYIYFYYSGTLTQESNFNTFTAYTPSTINYGIPQSAPATCYVTETTTTTTTSDFYSWYNSGGGGGAPLPSSGGDGLGSELSTHTSTEASVPFPEVVTKVKEVSNWLVSRSGRSALLFFGLLIILGLVLLSGSRSKGKRDGGRRRR